MRRCPLMVSRRFTVVDDPDAYDNHKVSVVLKRRNWVFDELIRTPRHSHRNRTCTVVTFAVHSDGKGKTEQPAFGARTHWRLTTENLGCFLGSKIWRNGYLTKGGLFWDIYLVSDNGVSLDSSFIIRIVFYGRVPKESSLFINYNREILNCNILE